jgi:formylglycine-generating enzyme required for sulfatase activity
MGSNNANYGSGFADHTPLHEVTLSEFALDAYEVTVLRFLRRVDPAEVLAVIEQPATIPATRPAPEPIAATAPGQWPPPLDRVS